VDFAIRRNETSDVFRVAAFGSPAPKLVLLMRMTAGRDG
jgi:hypothetical protein